MNPPIPWSAGLGWPLGFNVSTGPALPPFSEGSYPSLQPREFSLRGYAEWRAENAKVEAARILTYLHNTKSAPKELNQFVPDYMKQHDHLSNKSFMIDSLLSRQDAAARVAVERGLDPQNRHGLNLSTAKNVTSSSKQAKADSKSGIDNVQMYIKGCRVHPYAPKICPTHPRNVLPFQNKQHATQSLDSTPAQNVDNVPANESLQGEKCRDSSPQTARRTAKAKRVRTIFTPEQLEKLEAEFERQQYMVGPERLYLASSLSLSEAQVKVWFQNRRIKWRKQHLELQQQRLAALRSQQADLETEDSTDYGDSESPTIASPSLPDLSPQTVPRTHSIPLPHHLSPLTKAYFYVTSPDEKCGDRDHELDRDNSQPCSPASSKIPPSPQANGI